MPSTKRWRVYLDIYEVDEYGKQIPRLEANEMLVDATSLSLVAENGKTKSVLYRVT